MSEEIEIKLIEDRIKEIFVKDEITIDDVERGNYFINKWKTLMNWVERTEYPLVKDENYLLS